MRPAMRGGAERPSLLPWGMARVRGDSMLPALRPGDRLLVRYAVTPRAGDVVVAVLPGGTTAVKRAIAPRRTSTGADGWWLLSDHPAAGVDSRHHGPVPVANVLGVARLRLWPRPRSLRRRTPPPGAVGD